MAEYLIQDTTLSNIATAIRSKTGLTGSLTPGGMVAAISSIETSAPVSTCTVTVNHSSFTGYIVYQTSSGWISKYVSSTATYTDVIVGSLIFIIADKSLDYSIDSVSLSGEAVAESAIIQDSSSTATYVTINGDCTIKIYGNW